MAHCKVMAADPSVKAKEPIGPEQQADEAATTPLVVWASRLAVYFLAQGGILLLSSAYYDPIHAAVGFKTDPTVSPSASDWLVAAYSRSVVCRASVAIVPETPLPQGPTL